jgi:hypothetical protein
MNKAACTIVSTLVVTVSAFGGFYLLSRPLLRAFGISEYATGVSLLGLLVICTTSALVGTVIGFLLFPAVLRPFTSAEEFWGWIGSSRGIKLPGLDPVLERWAVLLYGPRPHTSHRKR